MRKKKGRGTEDREDASGGGGGREQGFGSGSEKEEVERVGRVKRPRPMRVRLDKTEVECRGRERWEVTLSQDRPWCNVGLMLVILGAVELRREVMRKISADDVPSGGINTVIELIIATKSGTACEFN